MMKTNWICSSPMRDKILRLPTGLSAFEEALSMEERGDEQAAIQMYGRP